MTIAKTTKEIRLEFLSKRGISLDRDMLISEEFIEDQIWFEKQIREIGYLLGTKIG